MSDILSQEELDALLAQVRQQEQDGGQADEPPPPPPKPKAKAAAPAPRTGGGGGGGPSTPYDDEGSNIDLILNLGCDRDELP